VGRADLNGREGVVCFALDASRGALLSRCVCVCVCVDVYMCVCICTHTHTTHTQTYRHRVIGSVFFGLPRPLFATEVKDTASLPALSIASLTIPLTSLNLFLTKCPLIADDIAVDALSNVVSSYQSCLSYFAFQPLHDLMLMLKKSNHTLYSLYHLKKYDYLIKKLDQLKDLQQLYQHLVYDILPYQVIKYNHEDGGNSFVYKVENKQLNSIIFKLTNAFYSCSDTYYGRA
jgi:hypothetical protein